MRCKSLIHILLLIAKVLGILILILVGLLLSAALLVLFVPVRYRIQGFWKEERAGEGKISWLFGAVSLQAGYGGTKKDFWAGVRLFGRKLWEMGADEEEKCSQVCEEEITELERELKEELLGTEPKEESQTCPEEKSRPDPKPQSQPEKKPGNNSGRDTPSPVASRLTRSFEKLKFSFQSFCDKLKNIQNIAEEKKAWLEDEENQASLKLLWKQTGRFLRHVCPRGGKGSVTFGFEEPYLTGQVLSAAALIYPFFEGNLEICPVFDETVFEAEGSFKGRIRAGYLLWLGLGILRDGHTRRMLFGFLKGSAV